MKNSTEIKVIKEVEAALDGSEIIFAPFTEQEVEALNLFQTNRLLHPFTCGNRTNNLHYDGEGVLIATTDGWICPFCTYTQDWAHRWMTKPIRVRILK